MKKNQKTIDILLGIYMIGGALLGTYGVSKFIDKAWDYPSVSWMGLVFGVLYILVGISGYLIIRFQKVSSYTILTQAMQVVGFSLFGIKYQFCAGSSLKIGYQANDILYIVEVINSEFTLGINPTLKFFYINVVPVIIIFYLVNHVNQEHPKQT